MRNNQNTTSNKSFLNQYLGWSALKDHARRAGIFLKSSAVINIKNQEEKETLDLSSTNQSRDTKTVPPLDSIKATLPLDSITEESISIAHIGFLLRFRDHDAPHRKNKHLDSSSGRRISKKVAVENIVPDDNKNEAFIDAVKKGDFRKLKHLLNTGADVNYQNQDGKTALYYTSLTGHIGLSNFLLKKGADIELASNSGVNALHVATKRGDPEMVRLLLERGANVDAKDRSGNTALTISLFNSNIEISAIILSTKIIKHSDRSNKEEQSMQESSLKDSNFHIAFLRKTRELISMEGSKIDQHHQPYAEELRSINSEIRRVKSSLENKREGASSRPSHHFRQEEHRDNAQPSTAPRLARTSRGSSREEQKPARMLGQQEVGFMKALCVAAIL
jgi:hypothetical protein